MMQTRGPRGGALKGNGNRLALEFRVKGMELPRRQCWIERDILWQIAEPPPGIELAGCRIFAEHAY
jgi:hypothetical protein